MAHINVKNWDGQGKRPCDWCGKPLGVESFIHDDNGPGVNGSCFWQESRFYIQLGYDGDSDVVLPEGYKIVIPGGDK